MKRVTQSDVITLNDEPVVNLSTGTSEQLALVDYTTLRRLINSVPKYSLDEAKQALEMRIRSAESSEELTSILGYEYTFRKTLEMVSSTKDEDIKAMKEQAAKKAKRKAGIFDKFVEVFEDITALSEMQKGLDDILEPKDGPEYEKVTIPVPKGWSGKRD